MRLQQRATLCSKLLDQVDDLDLIARALDALAEMASERQTETLRELFDCTSAAETEAYMRVLIAAREEKS